MLIRSFKDLEVWQKAHTLVLDVYRVTEQFPNRERFGVVSQVRRSAASIPANIAEGFGRRTTKELLQSLAVANGSLEETRYFLLLSRDLQYLAIGDFQRLERQCDSVAQMVSALARSLRNRAKLIKASRATDHGARVTSRQSRVAGHGSR